MPIAPMVRVQQKARGRTTGTSRTTGLPCATVLTLIRDLPGDRLDCPRRLRARRTQAWHQHRDARTTRFRRSRPAVRPCIKDALRHVASIASHPACRDDRDAPLLPRRDARKCEPDLPDGASPLFVKRNGRRAITSAIALSWSSASCYEPVIIRTHEASLINAR
jgi:hypothetical protein